MADQCKHCVVRGDYKLCIVTECNKHNDWIVESLQAKLAQAEAIIKKIAYHDHCQYLTPGEYGTGVADGHRCAAAIAREYEK
jgi:hypothetical protein